MAKEHTQDIFGEQSIYLDRKQKLKSLSGIGSIPDGYALILADKPYWYIVEVELSSHNVFEHVVPQVSKFIAGIKNLATQKVVVDVIYEQISANEELKKQIKSKIGLIDIHKFLTGLISQPPRLAIVIDSETEELSEAVEGLKLETDVIELRIFANRNDKSQRAYLFEPLTGQTMPDKLLSKLRQEIANRRPALTPNKPTNNYCKIAIGHAGIHLEWLLYGEEKLGIELHLERATHTENSRFLAQLQFQRTELEKSIGESLQFQSLWHKRWSRLYTVKEIEDTPAFMGWAVETMIKFYDVFKPLLGQIEVSEKDYQ